MYSTRLLAAILLFFPAAAAAQVAPQTDWRTPPKAFFIIPPLTAFPDPLSVAAAINPTPNFTAEAGVTLVAPGAFVRAGVAIPFKVSEQDGSALLLMAGYRTVVIPLIHGTYVAGPTASVAVRSWPRAGGWGWQLNVGGWYGLSGFAGGALLAWVLVLVLVWMLPIHPFVRHYPWLIGGGIGMLLGPWSARNADRPGRIILITLALMAAGFVAGGVAGMLMMWSWRPYPDDILSAGLFGGVVGTALGPLVAWLLMRHVPLWKAVAGTTLGTVGGWMLGMLVSDWGNAYGFALLGFAGSALVLRLRTPRTRRVAAASPRT